MSRVSVANLAYNNEGAYSFLCPTCALRVSKAAEPRIHLAKTMLKAGDKAGAKRELDAVMARQVAMFEAVSKLQPVERDIAVIVSERTTHAALMAAIYEASTEGLLKDAVLFDVYRPLAGNTTMQMGEKSLAVRLQLSSPTATLTEDAIETVVQSVVNHLQTTLQARLRA